MSSPEVNGDNNPGPLVGKAYPTLLLRQGFTESNTSICPAKRTTNVFFGHARACVSKNHFCKGIGGQKEMVDSIKTCCSKRIR